MTVAAVLKPILWDDEVYFQFAEYLAHHPLDPYGAPIWVFGQTARGMLVLAPPFVLYWWASAIALFGSSIPLTAVALFPFALTYTISFHCLARRFAPKLTLPVTFMATISAWPLVTINYMLDFPAAALALAALALFMAGSEARKLSWVVASGLIAGVALETKYNSAAIVGAMLLWSLLTRRILDGVLAVAVAVILFCTIEALIAFKYGQSHFVMQLLATTQLSGHWVREISRLREVFYGLIENSGPLEIGILLLLTLALAKGRAFNAVTFSLVVAAFMLSASGRDRVLGDIIPGATPDRMPMVLSASGLLAVASLVLATGILGAKSRRKILFGDQLIRFALGWLFLEVLVYLAMSPFPASRRMGEVIAAALLLAGRALVLVAPLAKSLRPVHAAVAVNAVCGVIMLTITLVDGWNVVATARRATAFMRANTQGGVSWQLTSLAFAHYFDDNGLVRLDRGTTNLRPGDLLVVDVPDPDREVKLQIAGLQPVATIRAGINLGVSVSTAFYRAVNPWYAAKDTRPEIVVFRASRPTVFPAEF